MDKYLASIIRQLGEGEFLAKKPISKQFLSKRKFRLVITEHTSYYLVSYWYDHECYTIMFDNNTLISVTHRYYTVSNIDFTIYRRNSVAYDQPQDLHNGYLKVILLKNILKDSKIKRL